MEPTVVPETSSTRLTCTPCKTPKPKYQYTSVLLIKYYSSDQIKKNEMGGACAPYEDRKGGYRVLMGRHEEKIPLGRPRHRWENNFKMDL